MSRKQERVIQALAAVAFTVGYMAGCGSSSGGGSLPPATAQQSTLTPGLAEPSYRLAITPQGRKAALPEWLPAGSQVETDLLIEIDAAPIENDTNGQLWGDWPGSADYTVYVTRMSAFFWRKLPSKLAAGVILRPSKRIYVAWTQSDCLTPGAPRLAALGHEAGHAKRTIADDHSTCTPAKCPGLVQ